MSTAPADGSLAVHELMTVSAICVAPPTRVRDALLLMERYGIRHLPVVEDGGVVGLVSKTDVREALGVAQQDQIVHDRLDWPVSRLMSSDVFTVRRDSAVCDAIDLLVTHQVGALPVVADDGRRLLGILSSVDVLRAARKYFSAEHDLARAGDIREANP